MVLVDELIDYPHKPHGHGQWCHMMTDNEDLEELHVMAERIGLRREYFQHHNPRYPHYDLIPERRQLALQYGAVAVSSEELIQRCARPLAGKTERRA